MAQVAQETFVAQLADGSSLHVARGSTWADRHEVVRMDRGRGHLFKPLDLDEADAPKSDPAEPAAGAAEPEAGPEAEPEAEPDAAAEPVRAARSRRGAAKASS
jgi:hypothetical protein